jgi:SAM-dependent methyltransferase
MTRGLWGACAVQRFLASLHRLRFPPVAENCSRPLAARGTRAFRPPAPFGSLGALARQLARRLGYELRLVDSEPCQPPVWTIPTGPRPDDGYYSLVSQLANRSFTPCSRRYYPYNSGHDERLKYLLYFLDVRNCRVLELGPFEGYHTVLLDKLGAASIVAIEARRANFERCLSIQKRYELTNVTFVHDDIERLYSGNGTVPVGNVDLVFACGVLYHLSDPARALAWSRSLSSRLFLGTHYVEPAVKHLYPPTNDDYEFDGQHFLVKRMAEDGGPLAGLGTSSPWLTLPDLVCILHKVGYTRVDILGTDLHAGVPHVTIIAEAD